MKFKIYLPVKVRHEYFDRAMGSISQYWGDTLVVNQTGQEMHLPGVEVVNPGGMYFSKLMNWIQQDAIARDLDCFFWMHSDAECRQDVIREILSEEDWDIRFTNFDALSATKIEVAQAIHWDEQFKWYVGDIDYYRRVSLAGYRIKNPGVHDGEGLVKNGVFHAPSSTRLAMNARERMIVDAQTMKSHDLYIKKWGGNVGFEKFKYPDLYSMRSGVKNWMGHGLTEFIDKELNSDTVMLEIGCYAGESSEMFAGKVKSITCLDPWDLEQQGWPAEFGGFVKTMTDAEKEFNERMRPNMIKIKGYDQEYLSSFPDHHFDFIYIDAIHTEAELSRQITAWLPKIKRGGKIGGHDYWEEFPGVKEAIHKHFKSFRTYPDTSWVVDV